MRRVLDLLRGTIIGLLFCVNPLARAAMEDPPAPATVASTPPVSFIKEVAPILVQNCIACHNTKKSESKYVMTTFAQLAKGGAQAGGENLVAGNPEGSRFYELCKLDGEPRMPWKQDPLPAEKLGVLERWIKDGAKYDGGGEPTEDWTFVLRKTAVVAIPESYGVTVPITAVAFSPDGNAIATSGYHEINLWKFADGTIDRRLTGLAERIYEIAYSKDGKWLATASGDPGQFGSVKLWTAEPGGGGKPVRDLLESTDSVFAIAFSPDSKLVAAAGADRAIRVWEVDSGKLVTTIEDHADWILDIAFSPDGHRLASASRDKTCKVFDIVKKESLVTFPGHAAPVQTVRFSPDGKLVVSGGDDNLVRFWNPDDEAKQVRQIGGFGGPVFKIEYTPDGKSLAACGSDRVVRIFNPESGAQEKALEGHKDWVYTIAIANDGKSLVSGSWDGEVKVWTLADGKLARTIIAAPGFKPVAAAQ